ncbi:pentatricopeptide repeat-containing protein [Pyrus ussuriensis x Pyrus communis]|uniref:Pentatricopeptide repeat-containing protein n=1 Tax=Pyrus ussuriensis x Pyrus communis TaxID=2448454 RepID=A0A5N5HCS1_9ROSA|nr:pentatricopeptide repeat-containing protein [Pyrus ussuriensis x Pyrus communis]
MRKKAFSSIFSTFTYQYSFSLHTFFYKEGLTEKTLGVVKAMKGANIRVSDNICCAVVSGFSRKNRLLIAVKFFEDLVSMGCQPGQEMEEKGFGKCVVAYSSMVVMYGKTGRPRDAMRLMAKMKEKGCKPNLWIYNSLMDMHGRDKNLRQVSKIWTEMKRRKVAPDKGSWGCFGQGFGWNDGWDFFEDGPD